MSVTNYYTVIDCDDLEIKYFGTSLRLAANALVGRTVHGMAVTQLGAWHEAMAAAKRIRIAQIYHKHYKLLKGKKHGKTTPHTQ